MYKTCKHKIQCTISRLRRRVGIEDCCTRFAKTNSTCQSRSIKRPLNPGKTVIDLNRRHCLHVPILTLVPKPPELKIGFYSMSPKR